ncbi:MAG: VacJ family lipoprotein [Geminicoccaceae bacterium]
MLKSLRFRVRPRLVALPCLLAASLMLAPPSLAQEVNDPIEPVNRAFFSFNNGFDTVILRPVSVGYRRIVPRPGRTAIRNFLNNLGEPVNFLNSALQGDFDRAGVTLTRFATNTFIGLGGLIDIATLAGHPYHREDFGQTLAVWGVNSGPYLVWPLLGPSNPRDTVGAVVDGLADPFTFIFTDAAIETAIARRGLDLVGFRARNTEEIDRLKNESLDYYATTRTLYNQFRANEIANGAGGSLFSPGTAPSDPGSDPYSDPGAGGAGDPYADPANDPFADPANN